MVFKFIRKYNRWIRIVIIFTIYCLVMFTSLFTDVFTPLLGILGNTTYGIQSYLIFSNVIIYVILFILSMILVPDLYYEEGLYLKREKFGKTVLTIVFGYFLLMTANVFGNIVTQTFGGQSESANEQTINIILHADIAWLYFPVACVIGPIVEEMIFRGILFNTIAGDKSKQNNNSPRVMLALFLSSIIFGLIHVVEGGDYIQIFPYMFMGLALGIITFYTKSIYPSIVIHVVNNTLSVLATLAFMSVLK